MSSNIMPTKNWKTVKEILQEVLNLPAAERVEFFRRKDLTADVKSEVESLLIYENSAKDFMSVTASGFGKDFFKANGKTGYSPIGQRVGVYEIVGELGFGGMGAVYLAERKDGNFSQKVAVKMLKRELNVEKIRRNFNREKEILATLAHSNIAKLFDAGTTVDGVPYLVMEYVEGVPIDEFCRENFLTLNARLKLFNRVCEAVAFAHRNLIVHRDLKPSNILVTKDGTPKLLDFGISKLLAVQTDDDYSITNLGAMTPQYASPEQIRGETVTTATDIYSLGVVLFKILTGNFPYDFKNKTNGNLLKTIADSEPTLPSETILTNKSEEIKVVSPSQLQGDLDNIILKSLSKKPEKRYQTVEQFAEDIWRFVDGLPVSARPNTFAYQARKFYRRNRASVFAAILVVASLFGGLTVALWQANTARAQARIATGAQQQAEFETERAVSEERKAKAENEKAEKISRFMAKIISYANPAWYAEGAKFGGEAKVIDAIEDLSDKIDVEFEGQADVQAELHHKFAEVFSWAGVSGSPARMEKFRQRRIFHSLRALELRKQFYGEWHELVAKDIFYSYTIVETEPRKQAELLAKAIQMMRETNPKNLNFPYMLESYSARTMLPNVTELHESYRAAIIPATDENKYQIGERLLREALPIFRLHYKEDNRAIFSNECRLAYALAMQEKWTDFDEHYAVCKQGEKKLQGGNSSDAINKDVEMVEKALIDNRR